MCFVRYRLGWPSNFSVYTQIIVYFDVVYQGMNHNKIAFMVSWLPLITRLQIVVLQFTYLTHY